MGHVLHPLELQMQGTPREPCDSYMQLKQIVGHSGEGVEHSHQKATRQKESFRNVYSLLSTPTATVLSLCKQYVLFPRGCRNDIEMISSHKSRTRAGLHVCRDLRHNG